MGWFLNPIKDLNRLFRGINFWIYNWNNKAPDVWSKIKNLPPKEFEKELAKVPYTVDKFNLGFDNTIQDPNYFFQCNSGTDCDDWAQMWYLWGKENGYHSSQILLMDKKNPKETCHMTCILQSSKTLKYHLADYTFGVERDTFQQCIDEVMKKYRLNPSSFIWSMDN